MNPSPSKFKLVEVPAHNQIYQQKGFYRNILQQSEGVLNSNYRSICANLIGNLLRIKENIAFAHGLRKLITFPEKYC